MEIVIGLIIVAAVVYFGYLYFNKPTLSAKETLEVVLPEKVAEPVIETALPAVVHVAETESVQVQNTHVEVADVPVKKAKSKVRAKTVKPKKPKIQVVK